MAVQDPGRTTSFTCRQCGMVCPNMTSLLEHMDAHLQQEEERKFKCDQCGRGYRHAGSLTNHKKTHEVGSFQCCICGKENWNASALKSHLRSHTSFKKYSCADCGKAFRLATQLATHEKVHRSEKPTDQSFRNTDMEYSTRETENDQHHKFTDTLNNAGISIENSPSNDKTNSYNSQCDTCDDAIVDRPFRCDLCDKSYIHHRSLINHRKTHQLGVFECTVCFKFFKNMAAFYSHQRTHKSRSRSDLSLTADTNTTPEQLPKHNQDAPLNFCHLCQVCFPNEEEFQEHIQMHNSSSLSSELQDTLSDKLNISDDNNIASSQSSFCASPINAIPSVSPVVNLRSFDPPQEQMTSSSNGFLDFSTDQISPSNSIQEEDPVMDTSIESPTHVPLPTQNIGETSAVDSDERPFKCHICGKSYRHSGSLINHKRSHQVGIYKCSICSKNYPHLAALKSHLRLHKTQSSSFNVAAEGDWLSSEPLTLHNQQGCFSSQNEQEDGTHTVSIDQETGADLRNGAFYEEQFNQDFSQDTAHISHKEEVIPRHMCADCGETFTDIAGIKSHSCPLLQQRHETTINEYPNSLSFQFDNGHFTVENPRSSAGMYGLNGSQSYFEENFHKNAISAQLDVGRVDDSDEEDEDGDHYQCSICGNNYSSMSALKSHLQGHTQSHDPPPSSGPSSLSSIEGMKDDEPGEMMICSSCGESFASRQDLISHQLLHNKDQRDDVKHLPLNREVSRSKEEAQIICGSCGIFCSSSDHLDNHDCTSETKDVSGHLKEEIHINSVAQREETCLSRETADGEDRRYKCDQCGRSYRHAGSLLNHKKSHKTGVFRCVTCQKRFYNLLALKNHQRSHFDIKRHVCHECGKAFKIQKQLLNHLKRHKENQAKIQELNSQIQALMQMNGSVSDGRRPSLAANNSPPLTSNRRRTQQADGRAEHAKLETSVKLEDKRDRRPFACDQCGRTYRHAGSLVNHRNSHKTGEYCCSVCNNTYSNQLAMKNHLRTHFANKKHLCQNCGRGFRGKKQLLSHTCADLRKGGTGGRSGLRRRTFKCKKCQKGFMSADQLADHTCDGLSDRRDSQLNMSLSKEERPFKCSICNRTYRHAGSLLNHKNTHKTGHFSCTFCSKPFSNPMALRNHTRIHTQKKKYVCLTCGKAFRLASVLHNHQRVHNRALSHFSCSSCGKSFQGRSGLKRHRCHKGQESNPPSGVQQAERADKHFMCDLVEPSHRHARSLLNHKKSNTENLHHCASCLQMFPDPLALQTHSQMRRQCCPECGKTFCEAAHLQSHMETHSKEQAVICSLCQQSFPNAASYQEHHDTHHMAQGPCHQDVCEPVEKNLCWDSGVNQSLGFSRTPNQVPPPLAHLPESITDSQSNETSATEEKSHVCEHCGRSYRHAGSLLNHKNSHKMGSFFCSVCQKEFTNLMALKNHRRIHTEPKRYQCLECGKAFRVSTQLLCHRRIHTKEKPFACLLCNKTFSSKSNLRHHQKLHQNTTQTYDSSFNIDTNTFVDLDMESFL